MSSKKTFDRLIDRIINESRISDRKHAEVERLLGELQVERMTYLSALDRERVLKTRVEALEITVKNMTNSKESWQTRYSDLAEKRCRETADASQINRKAVDLYAAAQKARDTLSAYAAVFRVRKKTAGIALADAANTLDEALKKAKEIEEKIPF